MKTLMRTDPISGGIDPAGILRFMDEFEKMDAHAFLIIRHGKVAAEGYRSPYKKGDIHTLNSGTKSFTAIATAFAEHEGLLHLDDRVVDFFPEYLTNLVCENMRKMTIEHLLTMSTGNAPDSPVLLNGWSGWVKEFIQNDIPREPGSVFLYDSGGSNMLAAILTKVTGMNVSEYLCPRLFEPLGIQYYWEKLHDNINGGGYGLNLSAEDYGKFGLFLLQKGNWDGKQLLPEELIEKYTAKHIENENDPFPSPDRHSGYGYQFWRCRVPRVYRADGSKGQFCIVLPEQDAVIVTLAAHQDLYDILEPVWKHLLPALRDDVFEDETLLKAYKSRVETWSIDAPLTDPTCAGSDLYERKYNIAENMLGITKIQIKTGKQRECLFVACGDEQGCAHIGHNGIWEISSTFPSSICTKIGYYPSTQPALSDVACSGGWIGEGEYFFNLKYLKSAFEDSYYLKYSGDDLKIRYIRNCLNIGCTGNGISKTELNLTGTVAGQ